MTQRLTQRVALVTGGATGLGRSIAERLASEGARVVISDVQVDLGRRLAADAGFSFVEQDVSDEPRWREVVDEVESRHGKLDILVNNAGMVGPIMDANPEKALLEDWKQIFAVNVESVFLGCRAAIAAMRRTGCGSIINMSSVAGLRATSNAIAYGASKAAVRHITKSVAQHCAQEKLNIRCNSVHPGDVASPLWDRLAADLARERSISTERVLAECAAAAPMGRMVQPEDVAAVVAFLASDDARYITGSPIHVDGGLVDCDSYHVSASVAHRTRVDHAG